jgi:flagellar biosynthesis protein FlhG
MNPNDQANQLRRLVQDVSRLAAARPVCPRLLLLVGGKGGVGTTTLAVNLAVALAQCGKRTVLADADPHGGNVALACGLDEQRNLADVIAGRRRLVEVLQPGPGGIHVAAGAWGLDFQAEGASPHGHAWIDQLPELAPQADVVLLDGGNAPSRTVDRLQQLADLALVVTTPETAAIVNAYARMKVLAQGNSRLPLQCWVNHCADAQTARQVLDRILQASIRFLSLRPQLAGHLPYDAGLRGRLTTQLPLVLSQPRSAAARQIQQLAEALATTFVDRRPALLIQARLPGPQPAVSANQATCDSS